MACRITDRVFERPPQRNKHIDVSCVYVPELSPEAWFLEGGEGLGDAQAWSPREQEDAALDTVAWRPHWLA